MRHFKHSTFVASFIFDGDKFGTKIYKGNPQQCLAKFNRDCHTGKLPDVDHLIELKQIQTSRI